jgi:hypothetical protein
MPLGIFDFSEYLVMDYISIQINNDGTSNAIIKFTAGALVQYVNLPPGASASTNQYSNKENLIEVYLA